MAKLSFVSVMKIYLQSINTTKMTSEFNFTICWIVPEACACCLQPCSILLHDDTVYCEKIQVNIVVVYVWFLIMARSKHIPIYLKGFPSLLRWLRQSSTTLLLHWFTRLCWYALPPIVASIDCRLGLNYMCHLNKNILYVYNIALTFIYNIWHNVRPRRKCLRIHSNPRDTKRS